MNKFSRSLILAVILSFLGIILLHHYLNSHEEKIKRKYSPSSVLIFSESLQKGSILSSEHFSARLIPKSLISKDMYLQKDRDFLIGKILSKEVEAEEIVLKTCIRDPGKEENTTSKKSNIEILSSYF